MKLEGQFDPTQKLKWGIGYIAKPGTGPETADGKTHCRQCAHMQEVTEPMEAKGDVVRMRHLFFCGKSGRESWTYQGNRQRDSKLLRIQG